MAQWVKVLATEADNLSSVSTTTWWEERMHSHILSSDHLSALCIPTHMQKLRSKSKQNQINKNSITGYTIAEV